MILMRHRVSDTPFNQVDKARAQELRNKCEDIHNGECLNWDLIYCPAGWETGLCPGANNIKVATRGSKFWSSKVCEGGESREAYACRLNFDPNKFLFDCSNWIKNEFSNNSWSRDWWTVRKLNFDPPSFVRTGSKLSFRSVWKRIKSGFSSRDH